MPRFSNNVRLAVTDILHRAVNQNSLAWVLCDLLVVMRAMRNEQNAFLWSKTRGTGMESTENPITNDEELAFRDEIIQRAEDILQDLEPDLVAVSHTKRLL